MIHVAQSELQELVRQYTRRICKAKETVIREDRPQPHGSSMQNCLMAKTAEARVSMDNVDLLPYYDISKYWEEGEYSREGRFPIDDEKGNVIYFESIREISDASTAIVCVCDYYT